VDVRIGHAGSSIPWTVEIGGERLTTRSIVIAAGAEPLVPPIPGLEESGYLDQRHDVGCARRPRGPAARLGHHRRRPDRLSEMAQAFRRLGSEGDDRP
jgi:hypothetical protein